MRRTISLRRLSIVGATLVGVAAIWMTMPVLAQTMRAGQRQAVPPPTPATTYLIRQDFSDCTNSNVNANNPSLIGGSVWVSRMPDGTTGVKVAMTAAANTTYHFFLKCVRLLGDLRTDDEGNAEASFSFATNSVGNVYAFDMYPQGAPAGNKYQSVQVVQR